MDHAMQSPIDYSRDGPIATIRLNDPDNRNGLSPAMVDALCDALARLNQESDVRCAILTGEGKVFSAGGDPRRMLAPGLYPDMSAEQIRQFYRAGIQRLPIALSRLDVPLIGAINGPAVGAGCDLACWCDLRIASNQGNVCVQLRQVGPSPRRWWSVVDPASHRHEQRCRNAAYGRHSGCGRCADRWDSFPKW